MRTHWGIFKAIRMTGVDDRGDFYKFWYNTVSPEPGEQILASWKVYVGTRSFMTTLGGNLLLTDRRLIFEPMPGKRAAHGDHGSKFVVNKFVDYADRKAPPIATANHLPELTIEPRDGAKRATLVVAGPDGAVEYFFSMVRFPIGGGHVQRRDEATARIREVAADARIKG